MPWRPDCSNVERVYQYTWGNNDRRAALKGRRCVIEARGALGTVLVRFLDTGERVTTSSRALRSQPGSTIEGGLVGPLGKLPPMWDTFLGKSRQGRESIVAADDAQELAGRAPELVAAASGASWYTEPGNRADVAVVALCLLRRAASGDRASIEGGDAAVREVLADTEPEPLVWLVSRLISYMDEQGFPELVEPWLARESRDW